MCIVNGVGSFTPLGCDLVHTRRKFPVCLPLCVCAAQPFVPPDLRAHSLQFVTTLFRENADPVTNEINEAGLQKCMALLLGEEGSQELSRGLCNR